MPGDDKLSPLLMIPIGLLAASLCFGLLWMYQKRTGTRELSTWPGVQASAYSPLFFAGEPREEIRPGDLSWRGWRSCGQRV